MKIDYENFDELITKALADGNVAHMRPVVEKELLHYDILFSLEKEGMLDDLTFQGQSYGCVPDTDTLQLDLLTIEHEDLIIEELVA